MRLLLLIPDGVGIRNFLYGQFIDLAQQSGDVVVYHALPASLVAPYVDRWPHVRWVPLPRFREGLPERVLRQAKIFAQLYWQRESGATRVLKHMRASSRWGSRLITASAAGLGYAGASARGVAMLDQLHAWFTRRSSYMQIFHDLLQHERPDAIFCTHQRSSLAVPMFVAARQQHIPTATFIYSWDNLPKGRMAVHADHFLVWSDAMKAELLMYYPEVVPARVHVVGTPQFEPYFNQALIQPREVFLKRLGLDPARPVLCFSGDDITTSPHDPSYLADVAESLRSVPADQRPQILFRRCPVDTSDRYQLVLARYPEIVISDPRWTAYAGGSWDQVLPTPDDPALLANIVRHCDAVINLGSTMAMDFAIFDKPGIYLAYHPAPVDGAARSWNVEEVYRQPHFRSVHALQPVYWVTARADLGPVIMQALALPGEKSAARRMWLAQHLVSPLDQASRRCYMALQSLVVPRPVAGHSDDTGAQARIASREITLSGEGS